MNDLLENMVAQEVETNLKPHRHGNEYMLGSNVWDLAAIDGCDDVLQNIAPEENCTLVKKDETKATDTAYVLGSNVWDLRTGIDGRDHVLQNIASEENYTGAKRDETKATRVTRPTIQQDDYYSIDKENQDPNDTTLLLEQAPPMPKKMEDPFITWYLKSLNPIQDIVQESSQIQKASRRISKIRPAQQEMTTTLPSIMESEKGGSCKGEAFLEWDNLCSEVDRSAQLESSPIKIADQSFCKEFLHVMTTHDPVAGDFSSIRNLPEFTDEDLDWHDLLNVVGSQEFDNSSRPEEQDYQETYIGKDRNEPIDVQFLPDASQFDFDSEHSSPAEHYLIMLDFERKRRSVQRNKLDAMWLRLRSALAVLHMGLQETRRAERLVLGLAQANQVYASEMEAIFNDMFLYEVEDDAVSGTTMKKSAACSDTDSCSFSDDEYLHSTPQDGHCNGNLELNIMDGQWGGDVSSLLENQYTVAGLFAENAQLTSDDDGQKMTAFRRSFEGEIIKAERLGSASIEELESIEARVVDAWDALDAVAAMAFSSEDSFSYATPPRDRSDSFSSTSLLVPDKLKPPTPDSPNSVHHFPYNSEELQPKALFDKSDASGLPVADIWLLEFRYSILVAYQKSAWERILPQVVDTMIEMEFDRQANLQKLLLAFATRQMRLFLGVSDVKLFGEMMHWPCTTKADIESLVEEHARILKQETGLSRNQMKPFVPVPSFMQTMDGVKKERRIVETGLLNNPLSSDLVYHSAILAKRGWLGWTAVLAVVTADRFLHLFDLPSSDSVLSPEEAFQALLLTHAFSRGRGFPHETMTSILLPASNIIPSFKNERQFEVLQHYIGRFGKSKTQKLILQTGSAAEASRWVDGLKNNNLF